MSGLHGNTRCVDCGVRKGGTDPHMIKSCPDDGLPRCFSCYQADAIDDERYDATTPEIEHGDPNEVTS